MVDDRIDVGSEKLGRFLNKQVSELFTRAGLESLGLRKPWISRVLNAVTEALENPTMHSFPTVRDFFSEYNSEEKLITLPGITGQNLFAFKMVCDKLKLPIQKKPSPDKSSRAHSILGPTFRGPEMDDGPTTPEDWTQVIGREEIRRLPPQWRAMLENVHSAGPAGLQVGVGDLVLAMCPEINKRLKESGIPFGLRPVRTGQELRYNILLSRFKG